MTTLHRFAINLVLTLNLLALAGCDRDSHPEEAGRVAAEPASSLAPTAEQSDRSEIERLNAFLDQVYERNVAAWPEWETALGRKTEQQGEWNDYSDAYSAEQLELSRLDLEALREQFDYDQLDASGKLSYDLFVYTIERALENATWRRHDYVVDQFRGQVAGLFAFLQNEHRIDSAGDAEDYVQRIAGLRDVFAELTRQLQDRAEFGVLTPSFAYPDMIADVRNMTGGYPVTDSGTDNPLMRDFRQKLDHLDPGEETYGQLEQSAIAALQGPFREGADMLLAELRRQQSLMNENFGVWALPDGDAYYRNRIRHHTALDLDPEEIHQIGLNDVERIHGEMRVIMEQVGFGGTLQEFFAFVRTDPNNFYENSDAGREAFLAEVRQQIAEIEAIAGQYFNILPRAKLEVRRVEPWRENSTSIAFYNSPSEDGSRPGIYYANMKDMANFQKYVFTAITYHESVPGHHFQIANAMELENIPEFRKMSYYGAYSEGWALYAEQLAREMGFYRDPMRDFGRLQDEIWRSVRLVTDTGIHALRWTREQAIDYFRENTPLSEGDIITEVERFFVNPGQALGYKLGMMKILELRELARRELGDAFDIRAFHDVVIGRGAMPLPMLERQVVDWIDFEQSPD